MDLITSITAKIAERMMEMFQVIPLLLTISDGSDGGKKSKFNPMFLIGYLLQAVLVALLVALAMWTKFDGINTKYENLTQRIIEIKVQNETACKELRDLRIDVNRIDIYQKQRLEREARENRR